MSRVLIVDDKEENVYYLQALLKGQGWSVETARHGAEALVKARQSPPALVVSDLLMPVMDGYTLLRLWKADAVLKEIPFVVYTATYTEPKDEQLALNLGADAFILKPTEPEDFLARIREVRARGAGPRPSAPLNPSGNEQELLRVYSETLIRKLEEKTLQLEESNRALRQDVANRERTEEALRLLNSAVLQVKESVLITDGNLNLPGPRIVFVNPAFTEMTGYPAAEAIGRTPRMLQGPRTDRTLIARLRETLQRGEVFEGEAINYRRDGTEFYLSWQITPIRDAAGTITHFCAIQRDITERKRTEQTLRDSEEKFFRIFQSSPLAMALSSVEEGRYLDVNDQFLKMLQRTRAEVVGHTAVELGIWAQPDERAAHLAKFKEHGSLRNVELEIRGAAGRLTTILWSADTVIIGGQKCLLGSTLDITERRRAEEELRWKTALLEAQIDSALDGILVVDPQGKKIIQNQRMTDLWKIPRRIADDKNDALQLEFVTSRAKNPREFREKVAYLYTHPGEISRDEISLVDGTILDRHSWPVRDKQGKLYGRIWTFRDITEQRALEMQFRQSQKMEAFGQLAGGVAHDFNNILAIIQLQAGLLKLEPDLAPQQLDFAEEIEKAAQRAANLTRQLLLFSRQQSMLSHDLDLKVVIANMTKMLQRTLGEQIHLQTMFSEEPLLVNADAGMIDQILLNLTVNARDAMPRGGKIVIEAAPVELDEDSAAQILSARPGKFVCLSVADTGTGIPPEILPRIFEPFFTTKEVGKGTGLGLATIFGIVQQHKGWINVYSEVDRGTTFRIYLPRLQSVAANDPVASPAEPVRGGTETILLVEDESPLRASVRFSLSRLGYHVIEASTAEEALRAWLEHRQEIRLLLTDMVMPGGLTGKDLAEQLQKLDPQLKVIFTSGYSAEIAGGDFFLEPGVNFLSKPFRASDLARMIRSLLDPS